ncbi:hypothetical protein [Noviherbaspirillum pedocola]|uniref:Glycosyltransferase n=1 Tax=Noviherbaspirillum pedocola TaxID=2801341 RepID=A0A934W8E5_9BURK|nr:hypothetical protein [Noviherbaspirillum pedocola]MBK4736708.1 hypothetical protein [Noviherbaspirillum pedocola]
MILSIVDRPRYGLMEHSEALTDYAGRHGPTSVRTIAHPKLAPGQQATERYSPLALLLCVARKECTALILWSVGITYLLLPLIRLLNRQVHIVAVCHEPGGLRQRLRKGDPFIYSHVVSLYECLFLRFADMVITPNSENSKKHAMRYAPLIFTPPGEAHAPAHDAVVYLGKRSAHRCLDFFEGVASKVLLSLAGREGDIAFFPTENSKTSADKDELMRHALCTVNIYSVPHNQSGVTPDSLRYGVPVIVSELDAFAPHVRAYGAGVVLDREQIATEHIAAAIRDIEAHFDSYSDAALRMFEEHFGGAAYRRHWMPVLTALNSKA